MKWYVWWTRSELSIIPFVLKMFLEGHDSYFFGQKDLNLVSPIFQFQRQADLTTTDSETSTFDIHMLHIFCPAFAQQRNTYLYLWCQSELFEIPP